MDKQVQGWGEAGWFRTLRTPSYARALAATCHQVTKRGRNLVLKIGDTEVDYDPRFRLYLQTKLSNPHYKPEVIDWGGGGEGVNDRRGQLAGQHGMLGPKILGDVFMPWALKECQARGGHGNRLKHAQGSWSTCP